MFYYNNSKEFVRDELVYVPARMFVRKHYVETTRCVSCGIDESRDNEKTEDILYPPTNPPIHQKWSQSKHPAPSKYKQLQLTSIPESHRNSLAIIGQRITPGQQRNKRLLGRILPNAGRAIRRLYDYVFHRPYCHPQRELNVFNYLVKLFSANPGQLVMPW